MLSSGWDILRLASSYRQAKILLAANEVGLFDAFARGPLTTEEAGQATGLNPRALEIVLPALVALGLIQKEGELFSLAPISRAHLLKNSEHPLKDILKHTNDTMKSWANLEHTLVTGKPKEGEFLGGDLTAIERFVRAMDDVARLVAKEVADAIEWEGAESILDLGGGPGTYALAFKEKRPSMRVTLFDLPRTLKVTRRILEEKGGARLVEIVEGDCAEDDFLGPYDLVWVSHLFHARPKPWVEHVLQKIHAALRPKGRVIIQDYVLEQDKTRPLDACLFSVHMLAVTQEGRCYSFEEYATMLARTGFKGLSLKPDVGMGTGLLVARKS